MDDYLYQLTDYFPRLFDIKFAIDQLKQYNMPFVIKQRTEKAEYPPHVVTTVDFKAPIPCIEIPFKSPGVRQVFFAIFTPGHYAYAKPGSIGGEGA